MWSLRAGRSSFSVCPGAQVVSRGARASPGGGGSSQGREWGRGGNEVQARGRRGRFLLRKMG